MAILPPLGEVRARAKVNEHRELDDVTGLIRRRDASINDIRMSAAERRIEAG